MKSSISRLALSAALVAMASTAGAQSVTPTVTPTDTPTALPSTTLTPTFTPTATPTSCGVWVPIVDPVTSPTNLLQQTVSGTAQVTGARYICVDGGAHTVCCECGGGCCGTSFSLSVDLVPNTVNHLTVCHGNLNWCGGPAVACTSLDLNGNPLDIEQSLPANCPALPDACAGAARGDLALRDDGNQRTFAWRWKKGIVGLAQSGFGNPVSGSTTYSLCVYDETVGSPVFKLGASIPAGGTCGTKPCWKALGDKGWRYHDPTAAAGGITKLVLRGGGDGKPVIRLRGRGAHLGLPGPLSGVRYFDQDQAVTVQLHADSSANCWSSSFNTARKNDGTRFKAVAP